MAENQYFSEADAQQYYNDILKEHEKLGTAIDKANGLRSIFDGILTDAINIKYKGNVPDGKTKGFEAKIDELFAGSSIYERLQCTRDIFNRNQHRYFIKGKKVVKNLGLTDDDYLFCLECVTDLIKDLSGIPVPSGLVQARKVLPIKGAKYQLEIVLMIELFDKLEHARKGTFILQELEKMIKEKDRIGLDSLVIHLITYSPSLSYVSPIEHYNDLGKNEIHSLFMNPLNDALRQGLETLSLAVDNYLSYQFNGVKCEKPWFMWFCNSLKYSIDSAHVEKLREFIEGDIIGFYPVALDSEKTSLEFEKIIPCKPMVLDTKKMGNLFKSILETLQQGHGGHRKIKIRKEKR